MGIGKEKGVEEERKEVGIKKKQPVMEQCTVESHSPGTPIFERKAMQCTAIYM